MNVLKQGWFSELNSDLWTGHSFSLEVEEILYNESSEFQNILVFRSKTYGNVLVLDGIIQCTEKDEFAYQEMISFLPLNCHPSPKKVLIVGGGDGGVAREVVKHPLVESVTLCEIDQQVVDISKKFLPFMSKGLDNNKLKLHIGDGFAFMAENKNEFDVIITDSSDPIGPAKALFEKPYYQLTCEALREGGIVCAQGECFWLDLDTTIKPVFKFCKEIFPQVAYASTTVPSYTTGQMGFILCSTNKATDFKKAMHTFTTKELNDMNLRYYNTAIHSAAFSLPQFVIKALDENS